MTQQLDQLTLVIPTFNRPDYVRRQVHHWREHPIHLLVMDGSPDPIELSAGGKCQVRHIKQNSSFQERMTLASQLVETPFVALCGDDDLYLSSGLSASLEMLGSQANLIGVVAPSVRFSIRSQTIYFEPLNWGIIQKPKVADDGLSRLAAIFLEPKIDAQIYGVYHTSVWQMSVRAAYAHHYSNAYAYEFLILLMMAYQGALGMSQELTWMSSAENPSIMSAAGFNRNLGTVSWLREPEYVREVQLAKQTVAEALEQLGRHSIGQILITLDQNFADLLRRYEYKASRKHRLKPRQMVRHLLPITPPALKRIYRDYVPSRLQTLMGFRVFALSSLRQQAEIFGVRFSECELRKVQKLILET